MTTLTPPAAPVLPGLTVTLQPRKGRPADDALGFGRVFTDHMFVMDYDAASGWHAPRVVPYGPLDLDPAAGVFHYGQAMFEGCKAFRGRDGEVRLFRAARHARRLHDGAGRLCMPAPPPEMVHAAIKELVAIERDWVPATRGTALYIRPTLIASEPFLGVRPAAAYTFFIILSPVGPYYAGGLKPVRIWIEPRMVRAAPGGLGAVKAGANYAAGMLAAQEAQKRGYAQVLWLDAVEHRHLEEMGVMNLMLLIDGDLVTPPLHGTILDGVTRDSVMTLARDWGVPVRERPVTLDELVAAYQGGKLQEVFGCGTAAIIAPVSELGWAGGTIVCGGGGVGPMARRLREAITAIQYGDEADPHGWIEVL